MTDRVTSSLKSIEEEFIKMDKENEALRVYINKIETNLEKMVEDLSFYENMFKDCPKPGPKKNYNLFENKSTQQKKTIPMVRSGEYHMTKVANDWRS